MEPIKSFTYCVTNIPSCCAAPIITWAEQEGVAISCPPNSKCVTVSYLSAASAAEQKCIKLFITCNGCGPDQIFEETVCFCGENGIGCGPCQDCGPDGLCRDRCPGKICDNGTCVGCNAGNPCPGNKVCVAGECKCPVSSPHDMGSNRCVECINEGHCEAKYGKCYVCQDGKCVYKGSCGGSGVCDPRTGNCEECLTKSDCAVLDGDLQTENLCCVDKKCVCCPGFVLDPTSFGTRCIPQPECDGERPCGPCSVCQNGRCVPQQCPDGQICVDGECREKCDCNNPASCTNQSKVCKQIDGICVCVPCGNCSEGCGQGCHCAGNNKCVVDKCNGGCTDGAGCGGGGGTGCGCLNSSCVECSNLSCANGDCSAALGCECQNGNCVSTGGKCVGNCSTKGECGPGCTCHLGKCVPCEFFNCANGDCAAKEGCRCNGSKCEGDPDYKCTDTLEIVQFDDTCDLEGQLTKDRGCACPVISTALSSTVVGSSKTAALVSGTHTVKFTAKLYLGNNTGDDNWLLSNVNNPDISINETANGGSLKLDIVTKFHPVNGVSPEPLVTSLLAPISGKGVVEMGQVTLYQMNGFPISANINERRIVSSVSLVLRADSWEFQNTCKYPNTQIGTFEVISNTGFGAITIKNKVSNSDTRNPKFIWYKTPGSNFDTTSWIRTVYVPLHSSGKYIDHLHDEVVNGVKLVESCNNYGLKTDCSCKPIVSKKIVFCKPPDFTAILEANSCGKTVNVSIGRTCHANKNKTYELLVNGSVVASFKLFDAGHNGTYTNNAGITSVTLRMLCNGAYECVNTKTFTPPTVPTVIPDDECVDNGEKVLYTFWKNKYNPTFSAVSFRLKNGAIVNPFEDTSERISFKGDPYVEGLPGGIYVYTVTFPCGTTPPLEIKKNCCEFFAPKLSGLPCKGARYWTNLKDGITYKVGPAGGSVSYGISKADLARMDLNKPFTFTPIGVGGGAITLTPEQHNAVLWSKAGCSGKEYAIVCGSFTYSPEEVPLPTPTGVIQEISIFPPSEPGDIYQIAVNKGPLVPYVIGTNFAAVFGENTIVLKKDEISEIRTLEIRSSADCDIEATDITVTNHGSIYEISIPAVKCPCEQVIPVPFAIKKVTKIGSFFRVEFYSMFDEVPVFESSFEVGSGAEPFVISGELAIHAPGFSQKVNVANTSKIEGYVDIPCVVKSQDPYNLSYTLKRIYPITSTIEVIAGGSTGTISSSSIDKTAELRFCMGWPISLGTSIASVSLVNLTNSQTIIGTPSGVCWNFVSVNLTGGADLRFVVTLSDGTSFNINALDVLNPTGDDVPFVYGDNIDEIVCTSCIGYVDFYFSGKLSNGCEYFGFNTRVDSPRYEIDKSGPNVKYVSSSDLNSGICDGATEIMSLSMSYAKSDSTGKALPGKAKVSFFENGSLIKREFILGGPDTAILDGTLPGNPDNIVDGNTYVAEVDCLCSAEKTLGCILPVISSAVLSCIAGEYYSDGSSALLLTYSITSAYPSKSIAVYLNDGTIIDITATNTVGAVTARTVALTEAQADAGLDILIYALFDANCISGKKVVVRSGVSLTWTRDCSDSPYNYDLVFTGNPTLQIISGTGTVVGNKIVSIPNNTQIVFRGSIGGCTSKEYTVQEDCTIVPSPSISVSVTRSFPVTPSITKSVTKSRSVSSSKNDWVVVYSVTPSYSAFESNSVTPSISISGSVGLTPSVTKSISITKSITPSISISQTSNVTPSVSMSVTPSVSITISKSVTPSTSAPCDGNCANYPAFEGQLCGGLGSWCCGGSSYDPLTQICCSGVVISAGDENNCGGCGNVCVAGTTCNNGVCEGNLALTGIGIFDGPCKMTDNSGYCISKATIGTQIPNNATDIALVSYHLSYTAGTQAGGNVAPIDITNSTTITTSPGTAGKTKVVASAVFDPFRVKFGASEYNVVVISYKIGNVNYRGTFQGGASVYIDWYDGGSNICASSCPWIG